MNVELKQKLVLFFQKIFKLMEKRDFVCVRIWAFKVSKIRKLEILNDGKDFIKNSEKNSLEGA